MFRYICLILLFSIFGNTIHANSKVSDLSFDCSELSDICNKMEGTLEKEANEERNSEEDSKECQTPDCHCQHGHIHIGTVPGPGKSTFMLNSRANSPYPELENSNPKNFLNRVHRPPIS
ncbi:MAG: hypothetical protein WEB87_06230 [Bacteriovoracaceae bacterium]